MTTKNKASLAAAMAASLTTINVYAQYQVTGNDGITASPKVRQMLNERHAVPGPSILVPVVTVRPANAAATGITASPKVNQMLDGQKVIVNQAPSAEVAIAGYQPNVPDGVAASPKVRQQLSQRAPEYIIAPLK